MKSDARWVLPVYSILKARSFTCSFLSPHGKCYENLLPSKWQSKSWTPIQFNQINSKKSIKKCVYYESREECTIRNYCTRRVKIDKILIIEYEKIISKKLTKQLQKEIVASNITGKYAISRRHQLQTAQIWSFRFLWNAVCSNCITLYYIIFRTIFCRQNLKPLIPLQDYKSVTGP